MLIGHKVKKEDSADNLNVLMSRDSNMELLRIIAMFLIMILHANFRALSMPDAEIIEASPVISFTRFFIQTVCVIAVNVFVLISGWYGIKYKLSKLGELLFECLFFGIVCIAVYFFIEGSLPTDLFSTLLMFQGDNYWFVKAYIALCIISPVLNSFVEKSSKEIFKDVLILYFAFVFAYSWISDGAEWMEGGYSLASFCGLYLLARYLRIYRPRWSQNKATYDFSAFGVLALSVTILVFILRMYNGWGGVFYKYTSPNTILMSVMCLLCFSKISIKNKFINWIAISSLSVYLTHNSSFLRDYYDSTIRSWFQELPYIYFVFRVALLIIVIYAVSILLDKIRILIWRTLMPMLK